MGTLPKEKNYGNQKILSFLANLNPSHKNMWEAGTRIENCQLPKMLFSQKKHVLESCIKSELFSLKFQNNETFP